MSDLKGGILPVVANPKTFLWAPFEMALLNIVLAVLIMVVCIILIGLTPFIAMVPLVLGHAVLIWLGEKNQHLTTLVQSSGKYPGTRRNIVKVRCGSKFTP